MARSKRDRGLRTKYAVLGDGQTEQYYLKHLKDIKGYKYSVYPSLFNSITIDKIEWMIDDLVAGGCDLIVYFTDYDTIVTQGKVDIFNGVVEKYAKNEEVLICETMPSIEFWFLLHYKKTTKEFSTSKEVEDELKKFITSYSKGKDFMKNPKWVQNLCSDGKLEVAIKHAAEIFAQKTRQDVSKHFPYTKAHLGIEKFEDAKNSNT